ncbi:MAG: DUF4153 domain-containing protein [Methylobacter sp.]|nr:DUF4153 domain-containing protein [Methylobacter sp.]
MKREERMWIIAWAALLGFSLLMLHNWVVTINDPGAYFVVILPLYVTVTTLSLTLQMLSRYRTEKLLWLLAVGFSAVVAGTASYVGYHAWIEDLRNHFSYGPVFLMSISVFTCWFILMPFAEHKLFRHSWCDDYTLLFSSAWSNTAKLLSAAVFVGLFWGLLVLWAGLFKVLQVTFFYELFTGRNFVYPVTAIAFGLGLSLYSAKEEALVNLYRTSLNVLGWLLPLVTFIMLLFLLALLFRGLTPLWKTGYATTLMLTLLGVMVFLFNAAWQDGSGAHKFPKWIINLISFGLVAMPLYIALCAYSLGLRIFQYGWSIERIWAALAVFELSIYAIGYALISLRRQVDWMVGAKVVNIVGAIMMVALLMLISTPVLDPARISVNSQIGRLLTDKTAVDDFDFNYLRFNAGKYGNDELRRLMNNTSHPQADLLHTKVELTLKKKFPNHGRGSESSEWDHEKLVRKLKLYPEGALLDPAFVDFLVKQLNGKEQRLNCAANNQSCQMLAIDLNADGSDELVFFDSYSSRVFSLENGKWRKIGGLIGTDMHKLTGQSLMQSLENRDVEALPNKWLDIRINTDQYSVSGN